jgi:hypothetical protein
LWLVTLVGMTILPVQMQAVALVIKATKLMKALWLVL